MTNPITPAACQAALHLLDTRVNGRYMPREAFRAAPPMSDDQAIELAIRLGLDDPEALRQGALLLSSRMTRDEIELGAIEDPYARTRAEQNAAAKAKQIKRATATSTPGRKLRSIPNNPQGS